MRSFALLTLLALTPLIAAACGAPQSPPAAPSHGLVAGNCYITVPSTSPATPSPSLTLGYASSDTGANTTDVEIWGHDGELFLVQGSAAEFAINTASSPAPSGLSVITHPTDPTVLKIDGNLVQARLYSLSNGPDESSISAFYKGTDVAGRHLFVVHIHLPGEALKFTVAATELP